LSEERHTRAATQSHSWSLTRPPPTSRFQEPRDREDRTRARP
jgi:hypothetical protein